MSYHKEQCEVCYFYEQRSNDSNYGFCHRYPPRPYYTVKGDSLTCKDFFTVTNPSAWCGEFSDIDEGEELDGQQDKR